MKDWTVSSMFRFIHNVKSGQRGLWNFKMEVGAKVGKAAIMMVKLLKCGLIKIYKQVTEKTDFIILYSLWKMFLTHHHMFCFKQ